MLQDPKIPPLDPFLDYSNPADSFTPYFSKVNFNNIIFVAVFLDKLLLSN